MRTQQKQMYAGALIILLLTFVQPAGAAQATLDGNTWLNINSILDQNGFGYILNSTPICSGATYCIFNQSGTTIAVNGTTQNIDFAGANAATIHNLAYATGGSLPKKTYISIGTFTISSTNLNPYSYSILDLTNARFSQANGANLDIFKNTSTNDGIEMLGGYIDVNGANQTSNGRGVQFQNTSNLTIKGTTVVNSRLQAFYIAQLGTVNDVLLDDIKAYDGAVDVAANNEIFVSGRNVKVRNCISKGSYDGGVVVSSYTVAGSLQQNDGVTVEGCDIQDAGTGIYIGNDGQNVLLLHNIINRTRDTNSADGSGIQIQSTPLGTNASSNTILDGNILDNIVYRGFFIYDNASDIKMNDNFVTISSLNSQSVNTYIKDVNNIDMSGNTFINSGGSTIYLENVQNSKIHSNNILSPNRSGTGGSGIRGVNISNVSIYSNDIFDRNVTKNMQYPILISGSGSKNNYAYNNNVQQGIFGEITGVTSKWQNIGEAGFDHGNSATAPSDSRPGDEYFNTTSYFPCYKNATSWTRFDMLTGAGCEY